MRKRFDFDQKFFSISQYFFCRFSKTLHLVTESTWPSSQLFGNLPIGNLPVFLPQFNNPVSIRVHLPEKLKQFLHKISVGCYLFHSDITTFIFSRKMRSIIRRIIFPYFSFTLLLALPKAAMTDYSLQEVITRILEGKGSWFIATLAIAEIEFACAMLIRRTWLFHLLP